MALAEGRVSIAPKIYVGMAPVRILGLNFSKDELEKVGIFVNQEPQYLGTRELDIPSGKEIIKTARLSFVAQTVSDKCGGIDHKFLINYYLQNNVSVNKDNTKMELINNYGESIWLPIGEALESVDPGRFSYEGATRALVGEVRLTNFLKALIGIPNRTFLKDGVRNYIDNPQNALAKLDRLESLFIGDYSEIQNAIKSRLGNTITVCLGARYSSGYYYQDVFTDKVVKGSKGDYIIDAVKNSQQFGLYKSTVFEFGPVHLFTPQKVDDFPFSQEPVSDLPFD